MKLRESLQKLIYVIINPLVRLLIRLKVTPNMVTTIGLIINIIAALVFIWGAEIPEKKKRPLLHGIGCGLVLFAGLFDMLDWPGCLDLV
jgi:CDP-diacylglycerol--glycerol-3-phosphate 3-phosphatidyltransferase